MADVENFGVPLFPSSVITTCWCSNSFPVRSCIEWEQELSGPPCKYHRRMEPWEQPALYYIQLPWSFAIIDQRRVPAFGSPQLPFSPSLPSSSKPTFPLTSQQLNNYVGWTWSSEPWAVLLKFRALGRAPEVQSLGPCSWSLGPCS